MKSVSGTEVEQEIAYTANVVELTADLNKRVGNYSGGMKRRLSLAIALLDQPELLVLDEPTVGIDPSLRRKIWHELKLIRNQGRSVLITTHVMDEAELTSIQLLRIFISTIFLYVVQVKVFGISSSNKTADLALIKKQIYLGLTQ